MMSARSSAEEAKVNGKSLMWRVEGMTCNHCVMTVSKALVEVRGVEDATVDLEHGEACVFGKNVSPEDIEAAIMAVGFEAQQLGTAKLTQFEEPSLTVQVKGMSCDQCENWLNEALLRHVHGVSRAVADRKSATVTVWGTTDRRAVDRAINEAGYCAATDDDRPRCPTQPAPEEQQEEETSRIATIRVTGMTCAACANRVERALKRTEGVEAATVNPLTETALVTTRSSVLASVLEKAVYDAGYGVEGTTKFSARPKQHDSTHEARAFLEIGGIVCPSCPGRIERALSLVEGVARVSVSVVLDRVDVSYDASIVGAREILRRLEGLGYTAAFIDDDDTWGGAEEDRERARKLARTDEARRLSRETILGLVLALPLALFMYLKVPTTKFKQVSITDVISWILATPVQFGLGRRFYAGALNSLCHYSANMDVLVALGSTAAYGYSVFAMIERAVSPHFDGRPCFETSAMLLAFVLLGKLLEVRAKGKTSAALQTLLQLRPAEATLVFGDEGEEEVVPVQNIRRGDLVKVKPADRIPADGCIVNGSTNVDESMLTGESMPVAKHLSAKVYGGTLNEGPGVLVVRVEAVGSSSLLAGIIRLVERAQGSKTEIEAAADIVARHFVGFVVLAALCTFWCWFFAYPSLPRSWFKDDRFLTSFLFAIAALVVACPCALGLATPTAVMVGTGLGARYGVLIKGGRPLEIAKDVNVVVFDKTGTLTLGKPRVTDLVIFDPGCDIGHAQLAAMIAAAESDSEHPLARALVKVIDGYPGAPRWRCEHFEGVVGEGIKATLSHGEQVVSVVVGTRRLCQAALPAADETRVLDLESSGKTVVLVRVNENVVGCVAVADVIRDDARYVVSQLMRRGIEVWMMTGDAEAAARNVAASVGIDNVVSRARPRDKAQRVSELMSSGHVVAVVGDGINDGPALAAADLGVAIGAGAQLALEAAEIVLVHSKLQDVLLALDLSQATFRRIRTNLLCSLVFNALAIPVAAGALFPLTKTQIPPQLAALAMVCSSLSVVASSLTLAGFRPSAKYSQQDEIVKHKRHFPRLNLFGGSGLRGSAADHIALPLLAHETHAGIDSSARHTRDAQQGLADLV